MNSKQAQNISDLLLEYSKLKNPSFNISEIKDETIINNFHPFANGNTQFGTFLIHDTERSYWLSVINWNKPGSFHIVVFPENRSSPLLEIHNVSNKNFIWKYSPAKQDGKNTDRKDYFKSQYGSLEAKIKYPENIEQIENFLTDIFSITELRIKSDKSVTIKKEMNNKEKAQFLTKIFNDLKIKFEEEGHKLATHFWKKSKNSSFRQISVIPAKKEEYKDNNKIHYEILLYNDMLTFEVHHENKIKRQEFEELIKNIVNKIQEKYEIINWDYGAGKGFHKIINKNGINISDTNITEKLFKIMKDTYDDLHEDIENYYKTYITSENEKYQRIIEEYKEILKRKTFDEIYKWETVMYFQNNWNENVTEPYKIIEKLLKKQINIIDHRPKDTLEKLFKFFASDMQTLLQKIFDESVDIRERYKLFYSKTDELAVKYKEMRTMYNKPTPPREAEFAFLITCKYPDKYYFYRDNYYKKFVFQIGEQKRRAGEKYFHYLELMEYFNDNYVRNNTEIQDMTEKYLKGKGFKLYKNKNILAQSIIFLVNNYIWDKTSDKLNETRNNMKNIPLNQILYGPPGTGKTYHTINKAIEIINPEFDLKQEREKIKEGYERLVEKGQIVFTTFHQSMSYEDFIEGIKPKMNASKKGDIEYEIKDGIFKEISKKSFLNIIRKDKDDLIFSFERLWNGFLTSIKEFEGKDKYIFKTITESELKLVEIRESGNLAVMYRYNGQYQEVPATSTLTASKDKIRVLYENDIIPGQVETLVNDIKPLVKSHASLLFAVYEKFWKFVENKLEQTDGLSEKEIDFDYIFNEVKSLKENKTLKSKIKNCEKFVLIIDEVNRGNVSQIFGELITLIEEDKRIGKKEELKITLPYSKNKFGVPPNLYIIGTMNTADRSIEALDTALRRRFTFKEMPPKADVIVNEGVLKEQNGIFNGIDLAKMLETINDRIEKLIDKDHKIGHSYFLNIKEFKDLRIVFKDKIIPLLEEYFYGDYGKINLILGNAFVQKKNNEKKFSFAKNSDAFESDIIDDLKNRTVYYITNDKEWKTIDFQDIYK